jgi:hypothetical protein
MHALCMYFKLFYLDFTSYRILDFVMYTAMTYGLLLRVYLYLKHIYCTLLVYHGILGMGFPSCQFLLRSFWIPLYPSGMRCLVLPAWLSIRDVHIWLPLPLPLPFTGLVYESDWLIGYIIKRFWLVNGLLMVAAMIAVVEVKSAWASLWWACCRDQEERTKSDGFQWRRQASEFGGAFEGQTHIWGGGKIEF